MNKNINDLMNQIIQFLPNATMDMDEDGMIIINTGVTVDKQENIIPFTEDTNAR
jgi:hypothetical protein